MSSSAARGSGAPQSGSSSVQGLQDGRLAGLVLPGVQRPCLLAQRGIGGFDHRPRVDQDIRHDHRQEGRIGPCQPELDGPLVERRRRLEYLVEAVAEREQAVGEPFPELVDEGAAPELVAEGDVIGRQRAAVVEGRFDQLAGDRQPVLTDLAWLSGQIGHRRERIVVAVDGAVDQA